MEYRVSVDTSDIHEAISLLASALYGFAEEALTAHENDETDESEFESFARDILGVIASHADLLAESPLRDEAEGDGEELNSHE